MDKTKIKPIKSFIVSIKGDKWHVGLLSKTIFEQFFGDCMGVTTVTDKGNRKQIFLKGPKVSRDTIAHELLHAFLWWRQFKGKSYGVIEEETCEEIGKSYKRLYFLTNFIYKRIHG